MKPEEIELRALHRVRRRLLLALGASVLLVAQVHGVLARRQAHEALTAARWMLQALAIDARAARDTEDLDAFHVHEAPLPDPGASDLAGKIGRTIQAVQFQSPRWLDALGGPGAADAGSTSFETARSVLAGPRRVIRCVEPAKTIRLDGDRFDRVAIGARGDFAVALADRLAARIDQDPRYAGLDSNRIEAVIAVATMSIVDRCRVMAGPAPDDLGLRPLRQLEFRTVESPVADREPGGGSVVVPITARLREVTWPISIRTRGPAGRAAASGAFEQRRARVASADRALRRFIGGSGSIELREIEQRALAGVGADLSIAVMGYRLPPATGIVILLTSMAMIHSVGAMAAVAGGMIGRRAPCPDATEIAPLLTESPLVYTRIVLVLCFAGPALYAIMSVVLLVPLVSLRNPSSIASVEGINATIASAATAFGLWFAFGRRVDGRWASVDRRIAQLGRQRWRQELSAR